LGVILIGPLLAFHFGEVLLFGASKLFLTGWLLYPKDSGAGGVSFGHWLLDLGVSPGGGGLGSPPIKPFGV